MRSATAAWVKTEANLKEEGKEICFNESVIKSGGKKKIISLFFFFQGWQFVVGIVKLYWPFFACKCLFYSLLGS